MKIISKLWILLLFLLGCQFSRAQNNKNVLFIAVDDLKPILGCYGDENVKSPNIDRLANQGAVFLNNYCQQAVCAPSRASLLTGMRPDNTKVWDLHTIMRDHVPDILSMPQYFRQNGYQTVALGKIFDSRSVDKDADKLSWSIPYNEINQYEYPSKYGNPAAGRWQLPETKQKIGFYEKEAEQKGMKGAKKMNYALGFIKPSTECNDVPDDAYNDGQYTKTAIDLLKKFNSKEKPFFLAVGYHKPHLPFVAPQKYWNMYNRDEIKLASWQKKPVNGPDIAMHKWEELKSYSDIPEHVQANGLLDDEKQKELIHGYYACVSYIDTQIGKLLDELKKQGLAENTIIVLWGDHGWHLGDHGLWCKHSNYEQATKAPLIIVDPGMKGGVKAMTMSEFIDIFPTLTELTGLKTPDILQGVSLVPAMKDENAIVNDFAVSQYPRGSAMGYTLRTNRYRYVEWIKNDYRTYKKYNPGDVVATELYDYEKDPLETHNLIDNEEYSGIKKELEQKMHTFLQKGYSAEK